MLFCLCKFASRWQAGQIRLADPVTLCDCIQVLKRRVKPYVPDFKLAFEHVCIHTGASNFGLTMSSTAYLRRAASPASWPAQLLAAFRALDTGV